MRRVVLWGLELILALVLGIGAMLSVVRSQPPPDYIAALHLSDCAIPCWIGIEPGTTTIEDARRRLVEVFQASPVYHLSFTMATSLGTIWLTLEDQRDPPTSVEVLVYSDRGIVTAIQFNYGMIISTGADSEKSIVTVARLHSLWGAPSRIMVPNMTLNRLDYYTMLYGDDDQGVLIRALTADPNAPVLSLVFFGNSGPLRADSVALDRILPWRGFFAAAR